jgi:predicted O-methyltransferase YrrM
VKIKNISYLLALTLPFNGYYASAPSLSQAQQPSPQQSNPAAGSKAPSNQSTTEGKQLRAPDVVYVPTPSEAVDAMLKVAKVGKDDIVYDLGSGDGRIPIMAVQKYNAARAVGIDINPERIKEAQANLKAAGVGDRVRFLNEDLFEARISDATVVTLYLLPSLNLKLLPKLLSELKPGTRIVSHAFDMGTWKPEQTLNAGGSTVYFWTIPAKGTPEYDAATGAASKT